MSETKPPSPKLVIPRPSTVERLLGREPAAEAPERTEAGAASVAEGDGELARRSYVILRGRIESLPSLALVNRRGQTRLIPWQYFAGASCDHPGELVLLFDGPEGTCRVTLSGRGLDGELLEGIKAQKVSLIRELDELAAAAAGQAGEPAVTGVWLKGGGREWNPGPAR